MTIRTPLSTMRGGPETMSLQEQLDSIDLEGRRLRLQLSKAVSPGAKSEAKRRVESNAAWRKVVANR